MIGVHVDDFLVVGENEEKIDQLIKALIARFKIIDLRSVTYYFGLCIIKNLKVGIMSLT